MSSSLFQEIFQPLQSKRLIDPHTHINPHAAASKTLADILGYHYYTELAHSAGMPKAQIEEPGLEPKEKVRRLVPWLATIENTAQYSWLIEMCQAFFGFQYDRLTVDNWEALYDASLAQMASPGWEKQVLEQSGLDQVYLTNDFDDPLQGFDTRFYVPCLRTDDLVFHLSKPAVRERLQKATNTSPVCSKSLTGAIEKLFVHFKANNVRACAISLPPDFIPLPVAAAVADEIIGKVFSGRELTGDEAAQLSQFVFWTLAQKCSEHQLPFDLMIGVNRRVYEAGVFQGQDLFDTRVSLIQYKTLFNAFPTVIFPVSVLAETSNQELVSYSWIFPNVVTSGHWWYSNIPVFIERDTRARLQAVPMTKQIGYYSDMYKLEFALPKFAMYRRILAKVLAEDFVIGRRWSVEQAISLGKRILRGNVEAIFGGCS
ncbi:MAG: glucuronate isomerase [Planctomycetaceae bacterium]